MEQNQLATKEQVKAINAILATSGQMDNKAEIISNSTNGRTTHSKELLFEEAAALLKALTNAKSYGETLTQPSTKMNAKLFAIAHKMGWVKENVIVGENGLEKKKDYSILHSWIQTKGYLHKPLNQYTYNELPKLVYQLNEVYNYYIKNL